ncbi:MAG: SpoIIE family protein phosphatase [Planctomycetia bacterium]|nr:SpoIIE family protein phosphatase [Planctomycetia bacterium]
MIQDKRQLGNRDNSGGEIPAHMEGEPPRLVDLIDLEKLQELQDSFSRLVGAAISIRDDEGNFITTPSGKSRFCKLLSAGGAGEDPCRVAYSGAMNGAGGQEGFVRYVCHAGLAQYAASIELDGHLLGTIVLGDKPLEPITLEEVTRIAASLGVEAKELWSAAQELEPWRDNAMRDAIEFLQLFAGILTRICYQESVLGKRVKELAALAETSNVLASNLDPDAVLDTIVKTMAEVMGVKGCNVRILSESGEELVIKAAYGMSAGYLKKGPVIVAENVYDRRALNGEVVQIVNMATDAHVSYPAEAMREGLVSSLAIGLISKGRQLGTLHIYTDHPHRFGEDEIRMFRAIASQAATAVENAHLLEELVSRRQSDRELALAGEVQQRMLPAATPEIPGYDLFGKMVPCRQVAGDYYDFIELGGGRHWGLAIGDVSGKGVPAAILMTSVRSSLRAQVQNVYDLDDVIQRVNAQLCADTLPEEFMTLFYAVLDTRERRLTYVNAGHAPPVLIRGGKTELLETGGPLLGVLAEARFEKGIVDLEPGDCLVLYTDGVTDAKNYDGERFGHDRLIEEITGHYGQSSERIVNELFWDIRRFAGLAQRADDITLMILRVPRREGDASSVSQRHR